MNQEEGGGSNKALMSLSYPSNFWNLIERAQNTFFDCEVPVPHFRVLNQPVFREE